MLEKTPEQKAAHNAYMKAYREANIERWNENVRKRRLANPAKKQAEDREYRRKRKLLGIMPTEEQRKKACEYAAKRRIENPELAAAAKKKYYQSEKGKLQKRKEELAFKASGGRTKAESKRAMFPVSEARKEARLRYQLKRRATETALTAFDSFVLEEAVRLCKLRKQATGSPWHVDHIIPVSKGGSSCADNLQVVPAQWNQQKSNLHSGRFFSHAKGTM